MEVRPGQILELKSPVEDRYLKLIDKPKVKAVKKKKIKDGTAE
jgi:hypothetical protein